ncbi:hypothetical protein PsaNZ63_29275 [Pseudomonas syringae pv. actinidiae]|nr:hypothetical protein PsaNZ63_29275 [Pseudomonas syringae pv. actinidiae]
MAPGPEAVDTHTYARPEIARVVDVALDLTADFDARTLSGTATLDILAAPGANEVILDIKNLDIQDVRDAAGRGGAGADPEGGGDGEGGDETERFARHRGIPELTVAIGRTTRGNAGKIKPRETRVRRP